MDGLLRGKTQLYSLTIVVYSGHVSVIQLQH